MNQDKYIYVFNTYVYHYIIFYSKLSTLYLLINNPSIKYNIKNALKMIEYALKISKTTKWNFHF